MTQRILCFIGAAGACCSTACIETPGLRVVVVLAALIVNSVGIRICAVAAASAPPPAPFELNRMIRECRWFGARR